MLQVGELVVAKDWFNAGYIFPAGFKSRLLFRSVYGLTASFMVLPAADASCL
jgi:hypothetical protein